MSHAKVGPFSSRPGRVMENFRHVRPAFQKADSRLCHGRLGNPETSEEPCSNLGRGEEAPSRLGPSSFSEFSPSSQGGDMWSGEDRKLFSCPVCRALS